MISRAAPPLDTAALEHRLQMALVEIARLRNEIPEVTLTLRRALRGLVGAIAEGWDYEDAMRAARRALEETRNLEGR